MLNQRIDLGHTFVAWWLAVAIVVAILGPTPTPVAAAPTTAPTTTPATKTPATKTAGPRQAMRGEAPVRGEPASAERLQAALEAIVRRFPGRIGVFVRHLETGVEAGVDADTPYGMASTYKVPILVELMSRVDAGDLTLDMPIDLLPKDQHIGSGLLSDLSAPGLTMSLRNLATFMIILSDNSATDMLIDRLGADNVTSRMRSLGLEGIRVDRTTLELILDYSGIPYGPVADASLEEIAEHQRRHRPSGDDMRAARDAFYEDPRDKATARDMTELLVMIAEGRAASPASCETILEILRGTQTGTNRLRGSLPRGTRIAHKTGTIGRIVNDVGVISLPGGLGRFAISVFTLADEPDTERSEQAIAELARTVYDFFLFTAPAGGDAARRGPDGDIQP